jgi:hypothetical protein
MNRPSFFERQPGVVVFGLLALWLAVGILDGMGC